jgi:hypothetical protein
MMGTHCTASLLTVQMLLASPKGFCIAPGMRHLCEDGELRHLPTSRIAFSIPPREAGWRVSAGNLEDTKKTKCWYRSEWRF